MIQPIQVASDGLLGNTLSKASRGLLGGVLVIPDTQGGSPYSIVYTDIKKREEEELLLICSMFLTVV